MLTTLFSLPHAHQRHLWWSVYGPALLDCHWSPANPAWLAPIPDSIPDEIKQLRYEPPSRTRIGFHFEQVWQQFFSLYAYEHHANLAIRDSTRTLGELDLLLNDGHQQWHLELALKFYLGTPDAWYGPDSRDCLTRKLNHITTHQLPMCQHPDAQAALHAMGWNPSQSQAVIRGCLFYPVHDAQYAPFHL